jgi:four helix bundle protein
LEAKRIALGWRFEAKNSEVVASASNLKRSDPHTSNFISSWSNLMGEYVFPFEKLEVWQLAVELADYVLGLLEDFPPNKHIRLVGQMEAAVVSSSQNIAEGKGRQYKKEFIQYLHIAQGSLYEVVTLNEVFRRRKLLLENDSQEVRNRCETIDRKLNGLVNSLRGTRGRKFS